MSAAEGERDAMVGRHSVRCVTTADHDDPARRARMANRSSPDQPSNLLVHVRVAGGHGYPHSDVDGSQREEVGQRLVPALVA